jgi:hypothetical protein
MCLVSFGCGLIAGIVGVIGLVACVVAREQKQEDK